MFLSLVNTKNTRKAEVLIFELYKLLNLILKLSRNGPFLEKKYHLGNERKKNKNMFN